MIHRLCIRLCALALLCSATPLLAMQCLVDAGRQQIGVTLFYDPAYARLDYPAGDVPSERGVCTDVLIRAYRRLGVDLQQLVHEDMRANFKVYPRNWGLKTTDRNIDHRRVPNLARFFSRHGKSLGIAGADLDYLPGDIVTWKLPSGVPHIGIVSDAKTPGGTPLIVHNIGAGTQEENVLRVFEISGHFRYRPAELVELCGPKQQSP